jgi:AcrR family transcriptional regulator
VSGRDNQRARTYAALVDAAGSLLHQGRPPSIPDAAEVALVSVATAYRYFRTAEELWEVAALFDVRQVLDPDAAEAAIEAAGPDVEARLEVAIRVAGWPLIDQELVIRRMIKASLDRWLVTQSRPPEERPIRPGARKRWIALVLQPLRGTADDQQVDAIAEGLAFVFGGEAAIALLDAVQLSPDAAKERQMTAARWILRGGLADIAVSGPRTATPSRSNTK